MKWPLPLLLGATISVAVRAQGMPAAPDNSRINQRDRVPEAVTAGDQSQARGDLDLTARIRRAVLELPDLSVNGQNIKIIAAGGKVTLRGPVQSRKERSAIEKAARDAAGSAELVSQLEVQ